MGCTVARRLIEKLLKYRRFSYFFGHFSHYIGDFCRNFSLPIFLHEILCRPLPIHYTLKFNPIVIQDLEDEDDLDNVVSYSDDFANVYIVESPYVAIEGNIPNTQLTFG